MNSVLLLRFFSAAWLFFCSVSAVGTVLADQSISLSWEASASAEVVGYRVYYGLDSGDYSVVEDAGGVTVLNLTGFLEGTTYYFALTAYDAAGGESDFSNEVIYNVPGISAPQGPISIVQEPPNPWVTVSWNPGSGVDIQGYTVYYGTESGVRDNAQSVGADVTTVDIFGLVEGVTYYFSVVAFDSAGQEGIASAEVSFTNAPSLAAGPVLAMQQTPVAGFPNSFTITAAGQLPTSWQLEASSDLNTWQAFAAGIESEVNLTVVVAAKPALFFRLVSWFSDLELQLEMGGANRFPNALIVSTPYVIPWDWTLEASEDMQNWSPLISGYYSAVQVAIVTTPTPAMFFRLKGD